MISKNSSSSSSNPQQSQRSFVPTDNDTRRSMASIKTTTLISKATVFLAITFGLLVVLLILFPPTAAFAGVIAVAAAALGMASFSLGALAVIFGSVVAVISGLIGAMYNVLRGPVTNNDRCSTNESEPVDPVPATYSESIAIFKSNLNNTNEYVTAASSAVALLKLGEFVSPSELTEIINALWNVSNTFCTEIATFERKLKDAEGRSIRSLDLTDMLVPLWRVSIPFCQAVEILGNLGQVLLKYPPQSIDVLTMITEPLCERLKVLSDKLKEKVLGSGYGCNAPRKGPQASVIIALGKLMPTYSQDFDFVKEEIVPSLIIELGGDGERGESIKLLGSLGLALLNSKPQSELDVRFIKEQIIIPLCGKWDFEHVEIRGEIGLALLKSNPPDTEFVINHMFFDDVSDTFVGGYGYSQLQVINMVHRLGEENEEVCNAGIDMLIRQLCYMVSYAELHELSELDGAKIVLAFAKLEELFGSDSVDASLARQRDQIMNGYISYDYLVQLRRRLATTYNEIISTSIVDKTIYRMPRDHMLCAEIIIESLMVLSGNIEPVLVASAGGTAPLQLSDKSRDNIFNFLRDNLLTERTVDDGAGYGIEVFDKLGQLGQVAFLKTALIPVLLEVLSNVYQRDKKKLAASVAVLEKLIQQMAEGHRSDIDTGFMDNIAKSIFNRYQARAEEVEFQREQEWQLDRRSEKREYDWWGEAEEIVSAVLVKLIPLYSEACREKILKFFLDKLQKGDLRQDDLKHIHVDAMGELLLACCPASHSLSLPQMLPIAVTVAVQANNDAIRDGKRHADDSLDLEASLSLN